MKRKNDFGAWHFVKDQSQPDFWESMCKLYELKKGGKLTYKYAAKLMFRSHSRVQKWFTAGSAQQPLSMADRHHLFLAIQYAPKIKNRGPHPGRRRVLDRAGNIMSTCKEGHYKTTKERLPLETWREIAAEKIAAEEKTGIRHMIRRIDTNAGFEPENLVLREVKHGKRRYVADWPDHAK